MMNQENSSALNARRALLLSLIVFACVAGVRAQVIPRVCLETNGGKGVVKLAADAAAGSNALLVDGAVPRDASLVINPSNSTNRESGIFVESVDENNPLLLHLNAALTQSHSAGQIVEFETTELEFHFGYNSLNASTVHIPKTIQTRNFFVPSPLYYPGQPDDFEPGIHENVFIVRFRAQGYVNRTWVLDGSYAIATPDSPPCGEITYQGRLTDANAAANGQYDLRFTLFDRLTGGTAQSNSITIENAPVANGIFTANLNFGSALTNKSKKFLEIAVRPGTSTGAFTVLAPRQPLTKVPYAVNAGFADRAINADNAINADKLGGLAANQYLTGQIADGYYIRNLHPQQERQTANFNISGNGTIGGNLNVTGTINGTVTNATNATNAANAANAANADNLGNIAASSYVQTNDARLSDARQPLAGSANYIQNTATQQTSSNFNISGNGAIGGNLTVGGAFNANSISGSGAGLTGIFSFYSLNNIVTGAIPANASGYSFVGQTQTATLTASQRLTGAGSIPLAVGSGTTVASVGLCYQIGPGAITNFAGGNSTNTIVDGSYTIHAASATVAPGAGQVTFGLCVGKNAQPLLSNYVNGWVMATNN